MQENKNMQEFIGLILLIGTCVSLGITILGSTIYLIQHGNETISLEMLNSTSYHLSILQIWNITKSLSPIGVIEIGLFALVITQIIRVATLTWFYLKTNDYIFTGISSFILFILIYSLLWRH